MVRTTEPKFRLAECFPVDAPHTCPISGACALARILETAFKAFLGILNRHTLADLLAPSDTLKQALATIDPAR